MRTSCDRGDPGYANFREGRTMVYLNGLPVPDCITADEELRLVVVFESDDFGRVIRDGNGARRRVLHGNVSIVQGTRQEWEEWCALCRRIKGAANA